MSRFRLPLDPPDIGQKLLSRMTQLKIHMIRFADKAGDRNILCDFEILGQLRPDGEQPGDELLLKSLLREFLVGAPPETMPDDDDAEGGASCE
jgi:hypothetical protein